MEVETAGPDRLLVCHRPGTGDSSNSFENLRIVKVWMIFIFISSCLVSALLILQMKCWTIFGENILWTNLT